MFVEIATMITFVFFLVFALAYDRTGDTFYLYLTALHQGVWMMGIATTLTRKRQH